MKRKTKRILIGILGTALVLVLASFIYLNGIRGEFKEYLGQEYPGLSFTVGFTKIDPLYEKFYSKATCLEDGTVFSLSKSFNTKQISDNYARTKSQHRYNSTLEEIFKGSTIESRIRSITGGEKTLFQNDGKYTQINIHLADDAQHILAVKEAMHILKGSNITAERITFSFEKNKSVYEIQLSSDDYGLYEKDIEAKLRKIK